MYEKKSKKVVEVDLCCIAMEKQKNLLTKKKIIITQRYNFKKNVQNNEMPS